MKGFLKPKHIIVWFGVLIKVHIDLNWKTKPTQQKKTNNDGLSFQLNDYNLLRVIMRFKCK